ncbi:bifunctional diaminohydroxyphosphoribosylaminopyrimidine deaminase/5-amino-6-(5-phosphoribosylamino)uracil reductase RibD [Kaistella sp. PBT33-4]|uniref:bifunctional diaminohydroxyphosphoribosylaminopyrimidine deaminase/5-amino-6-(5-phosphoribosylamino)uracil reductase RibD n=1 Tax=Kaistella sp. PBT33-4 TaxID=3032000 RepID=UPI0023D82C93|nr:bifunctional diaminohydroxyphosphoribosylaminopyrimidine deaminase/5-amino-6-(5-phosphoribosylamino)uracil reductase RibD [Kaistella sp. PBT33-4]MDF0720006.1 bifunctional diaminohydroxyphosphoribosylaminopyrimidine deaminase/5-amino-6-(5-phosphoribosylamino)uracil reductase RibD [Kaistella sp. PBT33-4]
MNHEFYIRRCIELARKASGQTYPNPLVGSVIVSDNRIIGEGYHHKAGEAHAEINAIHSVKNPELLKNATIYVSLEPCAHYGRTPPCANAIVEAGIKKVVIGARDAHDKVDGKGIQILRDAGCEVISGILEEDCRQLNRRFFTFHEKKRPHIILKWAQSADGFLDQGFTPARISNDLVNQFTHQLRADENAILVGATTALRDNPGLTVRHIPGNHPVRILIDPHLIVPRHQKIYDGEAPTIIFNFLESGTEDNFRLIKIPGENFLQAMLETLYTLEIQSLIVEGGSFTLQQFIDADIWDEAILIRDPGLLLESGTKAPLWNALPEKKEIYRDNIIEFYRN